LKQAPRALAENLKNTHPDRR